MTRNIYYDPMTFVPSLLNGIIGTINNTANTKTGRPAMNMAEDDKGYTIDIAMPGLTKEMVKIELTGEGDLAVKVEKNSEKEEEKKYLRKGFELHNYEETFTLPEDVDKEGIKATVSDGILSIAMPKKEKEPEPANKVIEIN